MPVKLDHSIHVCAFDLVVYLCAFLCRYLTLAPETIEETFVEISDTEPEDPVGAPTLLIQARGRSIPLPYNPPTLLRCSLKRCLDPIHFTYAMFQTHTTMIPTSQQNMLLLCY